ncbi:hypothetical protein RQP46_007139 [Phenoliferia psychrophenolica]
MSGDASGNTIGTPSLSATTSLLSLPNELLVKIARDLAPNGGRKAGSLRLVCRHLGRVVAPVTWASLVLPADADALDEIGAELLGNHTENTSYIVSILYRRPDLQPRMLVHAIKALPSLRRLHLVGSESKPFVPAHGILSGWNALTELELMYVDLSSNFNIAAWAPNLSTLRAFDCRHSEARDPISLTLSGGISGMLYTETPAVARFTIIKIINWLGQGPLETLDLPVDNAFFTKSAWGELSLPRLKTLVLNVEPMGSDRCDLLSLVRSTLFAENYTQLVAFLESSSLPSLSTLRLGGWYDTIGAEALSSMAPEMVDARAPLIFSLLGSLRQTAVVDVSRRGEDGTLFIRSTEGDPDNPREWPSWKRYAIVILASTLNNLVCIGVSSYSTGANGIAAKFNISSELVTLGLTLYIIGFAIGPLLLAPLSEFFGRRPVYLVSWALFTIFQLPLALTDNIGCFLFFRFVQGFTGAAPLANTGGVVHDLFTRDAGGMAVAIYGPPLGNVFGGFISQKLGFRYLYWIQLAIFGGTWFIIYFCLPETRDTIIITLTRPIKFLFTEPITYLSAAINALTFGIIFLANQAFPLIFGTGNGGHGWTSLGVVNLTYLSFVVGAIIGFLLQPLQERHYNRVKDDAGGNSVPEARFFSSLFGIFLLPIGLFIAAWTSYADLPWIAPIIGFTLFGIGFYMIITAILNYVVDGYSHYAASSLGAVVMVRNAIAGVFPLFSSQVDLHSFKY